MKKWKQQMLWILIGFSLFLWVLLFYPLLSYRQNLKAEINLLHEKQLTYKDVQIDSDKTTAQSKVGDLIKQLDINQERMPEELKEERIINELEEIKGNSGIQFVQVLFDKEDMVCTEVPLSNTLILYTIKIDYRGSYKELKAFLNIIQRKKLAIGIKDLSIEWDEDSDNRERLSGSMIIEFYSHRFYNSSINES